MNAVSEKRNRQAVAAIARKDIRAIFSSAQMWLPMIIVPFVFIVVYPMGILLGFRYGASGLSDAGTAKSLARILAAIPSGGLREQLRSFPTAAQQVAFLMLGDFFTPLFLLLPVMVSSIISANSFAGEKEKKTLETLLLSPVSERDLLLGKLLASFLPSTVITVAAAAVYGILMDTFGYGFFGRAIFPTSSWLIAVLWLSPAVSLLSISLNVFISAKVRGFQEAQQLSIIVILPLIALFITQMTGVLFLGDLASLLIGLVLYLLDAALIRLSPRAFNRQKLFLSGM